MGSAGEVQRRMQKWGPRDSPGQGGRELNMHGNTCPGVMRNGQKSILFLCSIN